MNTGKKVLKLVALCVCIYIILYIGFVAFMLYLFSFKGYSNQRADLYTVAVNNIFGVRGYHSNGEVSYNPNIHIIETDDYGRTLFFYDEYHDYSIQPQEDYGMAFVIMQSSHDDSVYYYPDKCYLPYFDTVSDWNDISLQLAPDYLESFKKDNDWNLELNEDKCAKIQISKKKSKGPLRLKDDDFEKLVDLCELTNGYNRTDTCTYRSHIFCESDQYGRALYYVSGTTKTYLKNGEYQITYNDYAVIFSADGTCGHNGIVKISTPADSIVAVRELKQINRWNLPY